MNRLPGFGFRTHSYGQGGMTIVDRFGIYLSRRAILRELPRRHELVVLDLGCGYYATHLRTLYPHLREAIGVDLKVDEDLKRIPRLSFIESTIEEVLPGFPAEKFDLILMISVLEHLWDPECVLKQCWKVLKGGGTLLINVPTWRGKFFLEYSAFRLGTSPAEEMDDHKMYYDKHDLWPLLVRAGFKPSRIRMRYHKFGLNLFAVVRKLLTEGVGRGKS